uniref:AAA+ ATPase domain-containing protein n=1 Tax=Alloyangia mangrovi TaxID=1779329 RepID=A0A2A3JRB0_9RHOB
MAARWRSSWRGGLSAAGWHREHHETYFPARPRPPAHRGRGHGCRGRRAWHRQDHPTAEDGAARGRRDGRGRAAPVPHGAGDSLYLVEQPGLRDRAPVGSGPLAPDRRGDPNPCPRAGLRGQRSRDLPVAGAGRVVRGHGAWRRLPAARADAGRCDPHRQGAHSRGAGRRQWRHHRGARGGGPYRAWLVRALHRGQRAGRPAARQFGGGACCLRCASCGHGARCSAAARRGPGGRCGPVPPRAAGWHAGPDGPRGRTGPLGDETLAEAQALTPELAVRGELTLVSGPTGAGKTTLLRNALRTWRAAHPGGWPGAVLLGQNPATQLVADTVEEEVAFALVAAQVPQAEVARRTARALAVFGLADLARTRTEALSMGWKCRTLLAALHALEAEALFLDEPYAQLDADGQTRLDAAIEDWLARGCAVTVSADRTPETIAGLSAFRRHDVHPETGLRPEPGLAGAFCDTWAREAPPLPGPAAVELRSFAAGHEGAGPVLRDIDLALPTGTITLVSGANGYQFHVLNNIKLLQPS